MTNLSGARVALNRAGVSAARLSIVLTCPDVIDPPPDRPSEGSRQGITVGYVGNMQEQDGVERLIAAAAVLRDVFGRRDVRFVCIGDGAELPRLRRDAERRLLGSMIEFTGRLPNDEALRKLAACDICVQPDARTAFNESCTMLKALEYMSLGKPVVAFNLRETAAACGNAALYAADESPEALALQINLLADDPELRASLGQAGRRRIADRLGWARNEPVLLDAYRSLIAVDARASGVEDVENRTIESVSRR